MKAADFAEDAMLHVQAAIRELETAMSNPAIEENVDVVVCTAQGRLMCALEITKEALHSLEDVWS